jgi:hypothetical protein
MSHGPSNTNTIPDPVELTTPVTLDAIKFPLTSASPALWQARVDLAAVYRLAHNHNFNEGAHQPFRVSEAFCPGRQGEKCRPCHPGADCRRWLTGLAIRITRVLEPLCVSVPPPITPRERERPPQMEWALRTVQSVYDAVLERAHALGCPNSLWLGARSRQG